MAGLDPFDLDQAPTSEPVSIALDQSVQWRRLINIDPAGLTMKYRFRPVTGGAYLADIGVDHHTGLYWAVDVEPADLNDLTAGEYHWDIEINNGTRTKIIETGFIEVFDSAVDRRSHAEIMVRKIESVLQGRADHDIESYTIKSRSITKMSVSELMEWRNYYQSEISGRGRSSGLFTAPKVNRRSLNVRFND